MMTEGSSTTAKKVNNVYAESASCLFNALIPKLIQYLFQWGGVLFFWSEEKWGWNYVFCLCTRKIKRRETWSSYLEYKYSISFFTSLIFLIIFSSCINQANVVLFLKTTFWDERALLTNKSSSLPCWYAYPTVHWSKKNFIQLIVEAFQNLISRKFMLCFRLGCSEWEITLKKKFVYRWINGK